MSAFTVSRDLAVTVLLTKAHLAGEHIWQASTSFVPLRCFKEREKGWFAVAFSQFFGGVRPLLPCPTSVLFPFSAPFDVQVFLALLKFLIIILIAGGGLSFLSFKLKYLRLRRCCLPNTIGVAHSEFLTRTICTPCSHPHGPPTPTSACQSPAAGKAQPAAVQGRLRAEGWSPQSTACDKSSDCTRN